jgi:phosphonate transport system ATP-binding protein
VNPAIALEDARLAFGSLRVLDALGLEVPRGQAVALIGPSGAGKTTLLRVLAGMLPLDSGSVRVEGPVGLLYQNDALVPGLRTVHNVLIGRLGRCSLWKSLVSLVFPRELDRARSALRAVDLEDKLWAPIGTLSGGSASAWRSRACSRRTRGSCSPTSPRARSIRAPAPGARPAASGCRASAARR